MKILLDVEESHGPFLTELLRSLNYVSILKEVSDQQKSEAIQSLADAFQGVKLHEEGKKNLKLAKDLLRQI